MMTLSASPQSIGNQEYGPPLALQARVQVLDPGTGRVLATPPSASWVSTSQRGARMSEVGPDASGTDDRADTVQRDLLVVEDRFAIVPEWLLDADVSDVAVRLYAVLLRYGQTSGARMPSRRLLAQRLRKRSTDTVDRAMKELVAVGAVVVERRRHGLVNLTNRYVVRTAAPGSGSGALSGAPGAPSETACSGLRAASGGGGRRSAATPSQPPTARTAPSARARSGTAEDGRNSAAGGGRTDAARVAADLRPDPECLTQRKNPPPRPSTSPAASGRGPRRSSDGVEQRHARLLEAVGHPDMADVAARCVELREHLGLPARLWTETALLGVLADAVLDRGLAADIAVPALLSLAADPVTRSPARLPCPGPWWELTTAPQAGVAGEFATDELAALEARLAEVDGDRVRLQRLAREQLRQERRPVTRLTVARRACALLA